MNHENKRSVDLAMAFVKEVGNQVEVARLAGVTQSAVSQWIKNGMTSVRENDLRYRFPELECWKRFPPLTQAKA